jgi:hypothetical protein
LLGPFVAPTMKFTSWSSGPARSRHTSPLGFGRPIKSRLTTSQSTNSEQDDPCVAGTDSINVTHSRNLVLWIRLNSMRIACTSLSVRQQDDARQVQNGTALLLLSPDRCVNAGDSQKGLDARIWSSMVIRSPPACRTAVERAHSRMALP